MDMTKFPPFHKTTIYEGPDVVPKDYPGLTLLDYFAAQALPVVVKEMAGEKGGEINPFVTGMVCYSIALGMLAAREQPEEAFSPKNQKAPEEPAVGSTEGTKLIVP